MERPVDTDHAALNTEAGASEAQLRHERDMIAAAIAEVDAGQGLSGDALEAWLTSWECGDELPALQSAATR